VCDLKDGQVKVQEPLQEKLTIRTS